MSTVTFHKEFPTGAKLSFTFDTTAYIPIEDFKREIENFRDMFILRYLQNYKECDLSFECVISSKAGVFKLVKRSGKLMCDIVSISHDTLKYNSIINIVADVDSELDSVHKMLTSYEVVFKDLSSIGAMLKIILEDIDGYSLESIEEENTKDLYCY